MELSAIPAAVVATIAAWLPSVANGMAEGVGGHITAAAGTLFSRVRNLFRDDPEASRALEQLTQQPDAEDARATITQRLAPKLAADPALAAEIRRLLQEAGPVTQTAHGGDGARIVQNIGSNNRISL